MGPQSCKRALHDHRWSSSLFLQVAEKLPKAFNSTASRIFTAAKKALKLGLFSWRTRRDSNPWPSESESDTLSGWATGTIINKWKMSCTHRSTQASERHSGRWLLPGRPAAHWLFCLMLLPSRPDMVHRRQLHGTRQSTLLIDTGPHRRMPHDGNYTLL